MSLPNCIYRHQDAVLSVALELARLDHRLTQIAESIPLPSDVEMLFEERAASTPASHLYAMIGAVQDDLLREAARILLEATQVTEVSLRQEHERLSRR